MWRIGWVTPWLVGIAVMGGEPMPVLAQANLDAGKTPAQIFSATCAACHRSPRELRPTSAAYLREHYSTGSREAAAMAGYLAAVGSDARAVQQRRPPVLGAGQEAAVRPSQATSSGGDPAPAGKPRRPSDSVEVGRLPDASVAETESSPAQTAATPSAPVGVPDAFEE